VEAEKAAQVHLRQNIPALVSVRPYRRPARGSALHSLGLAGIFLMLGPCCPS
jgi:hypothetical protein